MGIKIELAEIQRISSRSQDIERELATDLSKMSTQLGDICENVQSSELTSANNNLVQSINDVASRVSTNLPKIIDFLNRQIGSYVQTNAETKSEIDSLISSVNSTFGSGQ